jgi:glutamate-1-semialdehyde 2,1-aminomutase
MKGIGFSGDFMKGIYDSYGSKRPKSEKFFGMAQRVQPGGDTRAMQTHRPFPTYMEHGEGCRLYDVDGNSYIDFLNNGTTLPLGHRPPKVVEAVNEQIRQGFVFGSPVENQIKLAQELCDRVPSVEMVRYCNSGTEATGGAIRLARAYTGKHKIAKMEGSYLGTHDLADISIRPSLDKAGPIERPISVPEGPGIPPGVLGDCIIMPTNKTEIAKRIIAENHGDLACVIVEPFLASCGMIPVDHDYVKTVSDTALSYKIPLVFDEVVSFRLARGGCQEIFGIKPDLTTFGKLVGGGTPVGVIGGCEELMDLFNPLKPGCVAFSGSYNGNPLTMAAGLATLKEFTASEIDRINKLGDQLRTNFRKVCEEAGIKAQICGMGSLSQLHFSDQVIRDCRGYITARADLRNLLHLLLMERGIYAGARCFFVTCTPMGEQEINEATQALRESLLEMRPYIETEAPELISS